MRVGGSVESEFPAALARLGPGVVSAVTTTVDFYDFSGMARVQLNDLARRLDPQDPRRDPYMDRMAGYFTVTTGEADWQAAYIPVRSSSFALFLRLRELLGPSGARSWQLVEFDPVEKVLAAASALGFALAIALSSARRRRGTVLLSLLGSMVWIPALLGGGSSVLALCLAELFAWLALAHEWLLFVRGEAANASRTLRCLTAYGGVSMVGVSLFLALGGYSPGSLAISISPLLCSLALLASVPPFCAVADAWRSRRIRVPVPYVDAGTDSRKGRSIALIVGLFALATVGLLPLARGGASAAPIPLFGVRDFSWLAAERLQARSSADRLPDFSDLVAHEAYQQALGLGRKWSFPLPDERVYRREYIVDPSTGSIQARMRTIKAFDSPWLASVISMPAPGSLEALLAAQGRAVAAAVQGPAGPLSRSLPFTMLVFCALLALLGRDLGLGPLIRGNLWRFNSEARRNQVP